MKPSVIHVTHPSGRPRHPSRHRARRSSTTWQPHETFLNHQIAQPLRTVHRLVPSSPTWRSKLRVTAQPQPACSGAPAAPSKLPLGSLRHNELTIFPTPLTSLSVLFLINLRPDSLISFLGIPGPNCDLGVFAVGLADNLGLQF